LYFQFVTLETVSNPRQFFQAILWISFLQKIKLRIRGLLGSETAHFTDMAS